MVNKYKIKSLKGLMLKLKLQCFGHLMWRADSRDRPRCWKRLKAKEAGGRGWDSWIALPTKWTWVWANSRRQWRTEEPGVLPSMGSQRARHDLVTEQKIILWRFTQVVEYIYSFLFTAELCSMGLDVPYPLNLLSPWKHLGCLQFLGIMNKVAVNIHAQVFVWT